MKNKISGYLYSYTHFIVEVVCFFYLTRVTKDALWIWLIPFIYDGLAFVPQSLIGYYADKHQKKRIWLFGTFLLFLAMLQYGLNVSYSLFTLILLCLGNAFLHVAGAEATLNSSNGKISPAAIFVSGGSFGVITGKLLAKTALNPFILLIFIITIIPACYLSETLMDKKSTSKKFDFIKKGLNPYLVIFIAFFVVVIRGYMGYGIPTSWNKTVFQTVLLFVTMGIGKALGGILSDKFGMRKVAIISTLLAVPFLCFGDKIMIVSLIGVMMFSMTMAITLAILVSVLKDNPGLAFGITTIGLFLGTAPIFFIKISQTLNIIIICVFSVLCSIALGYILKEDK
jgi:MFS family permease